MPALMYLAVLGLLFYWQAKRIKAGKTARGRAILVFAAWSVSPILLYCAGFFAFVGVEELTDTAIISEGYARALPFVIVLGLAASVISTLAFSITVWMMKSDN